jgi:hypothetical protein
METSAKTNWYDPECPFMGEPAPAWMDGIVWDPSLDKTFYAPRHRTSRVLVDTGVNGGFPDKNGLNMVTGRVYLSVVAGDGCYSEPRLSGLPSREYSELEVAIVVSGLHAGPDDVGLGEPWTDRFDPGRNPVLPYLPVEQVSDLVNDIINANAAQKEG